MLDERIGVCDAVEFRWYVGEMEGIEFHCDDCLKRWDDGMRIWFLEMEWGEGELNSVWIM